MAGNGETRRARHKVRGSSPRVQALCARFGCSAEDMSEAIATVGDDEARLEQHFDLVRGLTELLSRPDVLRPARPG